MLVVILLILAKQFRPSYVFSFVVGIGFGVMLDVHGLWVTQLPDLLALRICYLVASFFILGFGISLSNLCGLPIIPTDLFPREFSLLTGLGYGKVKTSFDILCLALTLLLSFLVLHRLTAIGIGTVLCAFFMGKYVAFLNESLRQHVRFESVCQKQLSAFLHIGLCSVINKPLRAIARSGKSAILSRVLRVFLCQFHYPQRCVRKGFVITVAPQCHHLACCCSNDRTAS